MTDLTPKNASQSKPTTVSVKLLKPHTHGGKKYAKDAPILVNLPDAEFLAERDFISKEDLNQVHEAFPADSKTRSAAK